MGFLFELASHQLVPLVPVLALVRVLRRPSVEAASFEGLRSHACLALVGAERQGQWAEEGAG